MTIQQQLIPLCTGERLRQAREKRGLDLSTVALALRIDEPVMEAIEEGTLGHLAPVYQRGYVTTYARFLKFEESDIREMLDSIDSEHPELHTVFPEAGNPNQADRWIKATSYVLASLLIGTLAWQFTHEAVRLSQKGSNDISGVESPQQRPARQVLDSSTQQIEGTTHVNASIAALDILQQQRTARNSAGEGAWAAVQKSQSLDAEMTSDALPSGEYVLDLTASGDSWVEISDANGVQLELDLVRGGNSKQYRGVAPFNIQFGRASAVSLHIDGQAVDLAPFTNGDVTQMLLHGSDSGTAAEEPDSGNG